MGNRPTDVNCRLTQSRLKELLHYDPVTGVFTGLVRGRGCSSFGKQAGRIDKGLGRRRISLGAEFGKREFLDSRLAWLYMTGKWPVCEVDHKDVSKLNCVWDNLREANASQQQANRGVRKHGALRITGISMTKDGGYLAELAINGQRVFRKRFSLLADAIAHRLAALVHHGEFARQQKPEGTYSWDVRAEKDFPAMGTLT